MNTCRPHRTPSHVGQVHEHPVLEEQRGNPRGSVRRLRCSGRERVIGADAHNHSFTYQSVPRRCGGTAAAGVPPAYESIIARRPWPPTPLIRGIGGQPPVCLTVGCPKTSVLPPRHLTPKVVPNGSEGRITRDCSCGQSRSYGTLGLTPNWAVAHAVMFVKRWRDSYCLCLRTLSAAVRISCWSG